MYTYKATCVNIVDGDTVDMSIDLGFTVSVKQRMRLKDIDTPETHFTSPIQKQAGLKVTTLLKKLIEGKQVNIATYKEDKYGRYLVEIFLEDGSSLNQFLLKEQYAKAYTGEAKKPWTPEELQKIIDKN